MTTFVNSSGATTSRRVPPLDRSAHVTASTSVRPATTLTYSLVLSAVRDQVSVVIGDGASSLRFLVEPPDLTRLIEVLITAAAELRDIRGE